jgi:hypothetical protein
MRTLILLPLTLLLLLAGCQSIQPATEEKRMAGLDGPPCQTLEDATGKAITRECTPLERVGRLFESVEINKTTLEDLRRLGFGPPNSTMETVPSPEIRSRLTKTTNGGMELLDAAVQSCVMNPKAAYQCELVIFTDSYQQSHGTNSPLSRITGLNRVDIVSGWSWEASFVIERLCDTGCSKSHEHEYVVRYKQFRPFENPPTRKRNKLPILNDQYNFKIPGI